MQQPPHAVVRVLVAATAAALAFGAPCWAKVPPTTEPGQNVGYLTDQEIDKHRIEMNFRRAYDGHVALVSKKNGQYLDVKCDMQVPGTVLFRAPNGQVYYIAYASLKQVDLSDDQVVSALAQDDWEQNLQPIQSVDDKGKVSPLELTREGFYQLLSIVGAAEDGEGQPAGGTQ
eukprot:jgi/Chrzof1/3367/Cz12g22160.t1